MSEQSADYDAGHAYTEYGVLVDRTSVGLGVFLAETTRDLERAEALAARSPDAWGYPAEVKARRVYVTDWTRVIPPAEPLSSDAAVGGDQSNNGGIRQRVTPPEGDQP